MKPGDYKLGSEHSRAAARMALKSRQGGMKMFELWVGHFDDSPPSASPWTECQESMKLTRMVGFPGGMTLAEVARAVGGYSADELAQFAKQFPNPLLGAEFYRLDR